ncbi:glycoside hydrolase, partial [Martensiomyces pterosporus]
MQFRTLLTAAGLALSMAVQVLGRANVVGYYPNWVTMPQLSLSKYTHVNFAFAIPQSNGSLKYDNQSDMPGIVTNLHAAGVKALISIGGWTGSNLFSTILKNTTTRTAFLNNIVAYAKQYNLDGIDIDWEYPGRLGDNCNKYDPANDTNNFLSFLQDLRNQLDTTFGSRTKLLTLAVRVQPFDGPNGPISDVSAFAKVVDYINLMQYDIMGSWEPTTGPNAPLQYTPGKGEQFSFASAIDAWSSAGWPTSQMNAGIPFYGHSTTALQDMSKNPSNMYVPISSTVPQGDQDDTPWADTCAGGPAVYSGDWQYKH